MSSWFVRWARQLLHAHILVPGRNDLCTRPMPYASQRRRARALFFTAQQPLPVPRARVARYAHPCVPPVGPQPVHLGSLEAQRCALRQPVARGSRQPATTKFVVGSTQAQQTELPHAGPWGAGQARYASDRRSCAAWRARLHGDVRLSSVCPPRCLRPPVLPVELNRMSCDLGQC